MNLPSSEKLAEKIFPLIPYRGKREKMTCYVGKKEGVFAYCPCGTLVNKLFGMMLKKANRFKIDFPLIRKVDLKS